MGTFTPESGRVETVKSLETSGGLLELMIAYLPTYKEHRARYDRNLVDVHHPFSARPVKKCGDAALAASWDVVSDRMDELLGQWQATRLGEVACSGIEDDQIIADHVEEVLEDGGGRE